MTFVNLACHALLRPTRGEGGREVCEELNKCLHRRLLFVPSVQLDDQSETKEYSENPHFFVQWSYVVHNIRVLE